MPNPYHLSRDTARLLKGAAKPVTRAIKPAYAPWLSGMSAHQSTVCCERFGLPCLPRSTSPPPQNKTHSHTRLQITAAAQCRLSKARFLWGAIFGAHYRARRRQRGRSIFSPAHEAPPEAKELIQAWSRHLERGTSARVRCSGSRDQLLGGLWHLCVLHTGKQATAVSARV